MDTPWNRYQQDLATGQIEPDTEQANIIQQLQHIFEQYHQWQQQKNHWLQKIKRRVTSEPPPAQRGLYLWGGVGIGKTYLMDLFYDSLPGERKQRMHFHHFMREIHRKLHHLTGTKNPLTVIARHFAQKVDVLCFDEFMVHEIADAMILGKCLTALFEQGIILITTSNIAPDNLYENGLHRELFLPTIDLIKHHCKEIHCTTQHDYRFDHIARHGVYFHPISPDSHQEMLDIFQELSSNHYTLNSDIEILGRKLPVMGKASEVIWFDFQVICALGRSKNEYCEIAEEYHTVLLSNVPKHTASQTATLTFFMHLVDILYDAKVNLIIEADVPIEEIYQEGPKAKEFQRTQSRLTEMQSEAYLHAGHQHVG